MTTSGTSAANGHGGVIPFHRDERSDCPWCRVEALKRWARQVLTWETDVLIPRTTQRATVEELLPPELVVDRGGARELVWDQ